MQLSNNPPPGIKETYIATKLNAKKGENDLQIENNLSEKEQQRLTREQEMFRKAHPDLFKEEEATVGQMVMLNGEIADEGRKKKKARAGLYAGLLWIKKWGLLIVVLFIVLGCFIRFPFPVHRKLPAIRFGLNSYEEDFVEVDGIFWQSFALAPFFSGTIRTEEYEVKVTGRFSDQMSMAPYRYFYLKGDYADAPEEFRDAWNSKSPTTSPIIIGRFEKIVLHSSGRYLLAPATDPEQAKEILKKEYATTVYWEP